MFQPPSPRLPRVTWASPAHARGQKLESSGCAVGVGRGGPPGLWERGRGPRGRGRRWCHEKGRWGRQVEAPLSLAMGCSINGGTRVERGCFSFFFYKAHPITNPLSSRPLSSVNWWGVALFSCTAQRWRLRSVCLSYQKGRANELSASPTPTPRGCPSRPSQLSALCPALPALRAQSWVRTPFPGLLYLPVCVVAPTQGQWVSPPWCCALLGVQTVLVDGVGLVG